MKKISLLFVTIFSLFLISCDKDDSGNKVQEPIFTIVTESPMEFPAEGGDGEIVFTIENRIDGLQISAGSEAEWIKNITVAETVTFDVMENVALESRQGVIVISYNEKNYEVIVAQNGAEEEPQPEDPILTITSENPVSIPAEGKKCVISYTIENRVDGVEVEAVSDQDWILINEESFATDGQITVSVLENQSTEERSAIVVVSYSEIEVEVVINQAAKLDAPVEFPENPLSTLTGDVDLVWSPDNSLTYADYYGDDYDNGLYVWGFYFMEFGTKINLYIEVLTTTEGLEIPTGEFVASSDLTKPNAMLIGAVVEDVDGSFNAYSWFTQLQTDTTPAATAPIYSGKMVITKNADDSYTSVFDLLDDKGNALVGEYSGTMIVEDFSW